MATVKKKKATRMRDLKPSKDAKGGKTRHDSASYSTGRSTTGRSKTDGRIIIMK